MCFTQIVSVSCHGESLSVGIGASVGADADEHQAPLRGLAAAAGAAAAMGRGSSCSPPPRASADYITALPPDFRETVKSARERSESRGRRDRDIIDSAQPRREGRDARMQCRKSERQPVVVRSAACNAFTLCCWVLMQFGGMHSSYMGQLGWAPG